MTADVLLVDGNNVLARCHFTSTSVAHALSLTEGMIRRWWAQLGRPRLGAVALDDGDGGRRTILPQYKATRGEKPPALAELLAVAGRRVELGGLRVVRAPGCEADDALATLTRQARDAGHRVALVSADDDLLQLVDDGVTVYQPLSGSVLRCVGSAEVRARLGVDPASVVAYKALVGDAGDNVPGVPGIGPVRAAKALAAYGSLEGVLEALATLPIPRGTDLREARVAALVARRVCALRTDALLSLSLEACRCLTTTTPGGI